MAQSPRYAFGEPKLGMPIKPETDRSAHELTNVRFGSHLVTSGYFILLRQHGN